MNLITKQNKSFFIIISICICILVILVGWYSFQNRKISNTQLNNPYTSNGSYHFGSLNELKQNFNQPLAYQNIRIDYRPNSDTFIVLYEGDFNQAENTVRAFFKEAG